ncbi:hypothetical protein GCM10010405_12670 [Streptomyces macrosporus]|uniref:Uncharacterized protein n=1 Tax=Streptomyces macrosporus TaxID=44032 RepID=A0ABP5WMN0_9ACTN
MSGRHQTWQKGCRSLRLPDNFADYTDQAAQCQHPPAGSGSLVDGKETTDRDGAVPAASRTAGRLDQGPSATVPRPLSSGLLGSPRVSSGRPDAVHPYGPPRARSTERTVPMS